MYKSGDTLLYVGSRPSKDVPTWMSDPMSFRRYQWADSHHGKTYIEVHTTQGSMTLSIEDVVEASAGFRLFLDMERGIRDLGAYAYGLAKDKIDHPSHRVRLRDINDAVHQFWGGVKAYQYARGIRSNHWEVLDDTFYDSRTRAMAEAVREATKAVYR